jgi:transposase InsO family protein
LCRRHAQRIPHRRTIERFLSHFPDLPKRRYQKRTPLSDPRRATRLHQLWQMDFKVNHRFPCASHRGSFLNIRDMASTLSILTYTLPEGRSALSSQEAIGVCRLAFTQWGVLPEAIRTDHGACFCAPAWDSFPTDFTLYLWGLGIEHELIPVRRPAHNGGIERDQRTFSENFLADYPFHGHPQLARDAQAFGHFRNRFVPSRSVRCQGQTPWATAQHLQCQAGTYTPEREAELFEVQRIYDKLASLRWQRTVDDWGYLTLGHYKDYVGRTARRQAVYLHFDRTTLEVVVDTGQHKDLKRWPIRGISYPDIVKEQKWERKLKGHGWSRKQAA